MLERMSIVVSIVVPIYNTDEYLARCVDSIINQTYHYLDIILVDDGSTDDSGYICDRYAQNDKRITVIHKKNGGLSDARNVGIECAKGDYICFVDSDDIVHKEYVERLLKLCIEFCADIAQCDYLCIDSKSKLLPVNDDRSIRVMGGNDALSEYCCMNGCVKYTVVWNKIYRKELFNNIRFPYQKQHEDEFTTYKLLYYSGKVVVTSEYLYYYLQRLTSIMGRGFSSKKIDAIDALKERIVFLDNEGLLTEKSYTERKLYSLYKECLEYLNSNSTGFSELLISLENEFEELSKAIVVGNERECPPHFDVNKYRYYYNTDWILYGAGVLGQCIYKDYEKSHMNTLKMWIDNSWYARNNLGYPVSPLDRITGQNSEYIIVAVNDRSMKKRIKSDLIAWGVLPDRIIA